MAKKRRPFDEDRPHVEGLRDWIRDNAMPGTVICGDYTVADLLADLNKLVDAEWDAGVEAMGDDR